MITVADALELEEFLGAQVVAGAAGLHRPISWVHNSGVPDAHNWVNGGELVLTTSINMPATLPEQIEFIEALAAKGVVALGVTVGRYIDHIPEEWCQAAAANHLTLLAVPFQARFIDIARTINERIAQESIGMVRRAMHINQVLSRLVLDGKGLQDLANTLADLIRQSISIETDRFDALAWANIAEIDEARRYTLEHGRTNPALILALKDAGILEEIQRTMRPKHLPQMPHVGLEMERILAPVVVHGEIYGYMWIIADGSPLSDLDWMALESGSTVAALMLLHQEAVQTAEASLKGTLLAQLIEQESGRDSVRTEQALRYGLNLDRPYSMLVLEAPAYENGSGAMRLYRRVNRLATEQDWAAMVGQFAGRVIVLLGEETDPQAAADTLHRQIEREHLRIGISGRHRSPAGVAAAHTQCLEVLTISRRLDENRRTACFDDLGYIHALYLAGEASLKGNPHVQALRALQEETQADLFNTLEAYLDLGGNGVATAEALHIHRSTLNYRLQRITQISGADLSDPLTRLNLQVALKLMRLFGGS